MAIEILAQAWAGGGFAGHCREGCLTEKLGHFYLKYSDADVCLSEAVYD
jgi:hypothetical protein